MALAVRESRQSLQEIADLAGTSKGQVSQWQTEGKVQVENIKAHVVESICSVLNVRPRWLLYGEMPMRHNEDSEPGSPYRVAETAPVYGSATEAPYVRVQQLDAEADMGDGRVNADTPEVIRAMDFTPAYIRAIVGFVPPPGRLVLVTGRGDSMIPTIMPGEALLVDTGCTSYDGDGIYLVNIGNGQQVKRLMDHGAEAGVYVHSDNLAYPAIPFPKGAIIGGKVFLRNRIDRFN